MLHFDSDILRWRWHLTKALTATNVASRLQTAKDRPSTDLNSNAPLEDLKPNKRSTCMSSHLIKQMHEAFDAFKQANDEAQREIKQYGRESGDLKQKVERLETALEDFEAKLLRKSHNGLPEAYGDKLAKSEAIKSFGRALRGVASPEELKVLRTGDDTAGGYLAPSEYVEVMLKNQVEFSPVRSIASVRATTRGSIMMPKRTGTAAAQWVNETGNRPETTNPSFGLFEVKAHEVYALTKVSKQELEDSVFDLETFLRAEFAEQFGLSEGSAFIGGSGINQPQGILSNSDVASVNSGHASQITAAGLIDLSYALKDAYQSDAYFCLSRETLREVRKLTDGSGGYLWMRGQQHCLTSPTFFRPTCQASTRELIPSHTEASAVAT